MVAPGPTGHAPLPIEALPIWQAPVGSVAGPELALAVAQAGGVGALALTWRSPGEVRRLLDKVLWPGEGRVQGNFVLAFPPTSLPAALEAGLRLVTFSWGQPDGLVALVRSHGARFGVQVSGRDGARRALDLGADFLVCQGVEAGGHVQATRPRAAILPEVLAEAGAVPVVAAGGMATGRDVAAALATGACAAMLGTRFVATQESRAHEAYKRRLLEAEGRDAVLTLCFDGGWPFAAHRVLHNRTLARWEAAGCPRPGARPGEDDVVARAGAHEFRRYQDDPPLAAMSGEPGDMCLYAGTGCGAIADLPPAGALVARLWHDCRAASSP
jgi:nitronate monooxygenase